MEAVSTRQGCVRLGCLPSACALGESTCLGQACFGHAPPELAQRLRQMSDVQGQAAIERLAVAVSLEAWLASLHEG